MSTTLIIPGLYSSGPTHWQTWLEGHIDAVRVEQSDWTDPDLPAWSARVRRAITRHPGQHIIVAHSFGALAAAQAANDHADRIAGALLVAPADPVKFGIADLLPQSELPFPTIVVASTTDPWMPVERAQRWAGIWRAEFVNLGDAGHINTDAGFGPWPEGLALLERLMRTANDNGRRAGDDRSARSSRAETNQLSQLVRAAELLRNAGWDVRRPIRHAA